MLGDVVVTLVLFESNGDYQPSTEDWNELVRDEQGDVVLDDQGRTISVSGPNRIEEIKDKVREGLGWWEDTLANFGHWLEEPVPTPVHSLNFIYDFEFAHNPVDTPYEPIAGTSNEFTFWMEDFLDEAGFATSASRDIDIRTFNHAQRTKYDADWAFTILVANDEYDMDGRFAPGGSFQYAFAYAGGRFFVAPASRPAASFTHETAHMFWARDEYQYSGASYTDQRGYYNTQNWNAWDNPYLEEWQDSLMLASPYFWSAYGANVSSESSLAMVGWQDSDADGVFDVLDVPLSLSGSGYYDASSETYRFVGRSSVQTFINQNSSGFQSDITINEVSLAEYSLDGGASWVTAEHYGSYEAELDLAISMQPDQEILIRTRSVDSGSGQTVVTSDKIFVGLATLPTWVATPGIHGFVWYDEDDSGSWESGESGIPGWTMQLVDDQGQPLQLRRRLEPDDYSDDDLLNQVLDGVTLTAVGYGVKDDRVGSATAGTASTGERVFGYVPWGITNDWSPDWMSDSRELRIDFDTPVTMVSIDAVARNTDGYGRLEIYDANGVMLDRYTTGLLQSDMVETMSLGRPTAEIAYAIAGSHMNSMIRLDNLVVGPENTTVTDGLGAYHFPGLPAGDYRVQAIPSNPWEVAQPDDAVQEITVLADGTIKTPTVPGRGTDFAGQLTSPEHPFQNPIQAHDVDANGFVQPRDALLIINELNRGGIQELSVLDGDSIPPPYFDVSGDNLLSPYDALLVINRLNDADKGESEPAGGNVTGGEGTGPEGEAPLGESTSAYAVASTTTIPDEFGIGGLSTLRERAADRSLSPAASGSEPTTRRQMDGRQDRSLGYDRSHLGTVSTDTVVASAVDFLLDYGPQRNTDSDVTSFDTLPLEDALDAVFADLWRMPDDSIR